MPPYVDSCFDYLNLGSLLTHEENVYLLIYSEEARLRIRQFVQLEVIPTIDPYVEEAKFPEYLVPKLRATNILNDFLKPPYENHYRHLLKELLLLNWREEMPVFVQWF